jgi:antitoxin component of MazEF toxin-antitoxin module
MKNMRAKLRQVGNSVGLTIPASELRALEAEVGDEIELEIVRVVRPLRAAWDDPGKWQGAREAELLLDDQPPSDFDADEWQW